MAVGYLRQEVAPLLESWYDEATGRDLLAAIAELQLDVRWMAYDAGSHTLAQHYMRHALRLAHAAGNRLLGGRVLGAMSHQALHLQRVTLALDLTRAAMHGTARVATPKATAMLAAMEACAHAAAHDELACTAALAKAEIALGQSSDGDDDPAWLDFDEGGLSGHAARAFRDLQLPAPAEQHATRSIALCRADHGRTHAQRQAILATVCLQRGDLDQAATIGTQIVAEGWKLQSHHVYGEVATILRGVQTNPSRTTAAFTEQARELLTARTARPPKATT